MLLRQFSMKPEYKMHFMTNGGSAIHRLDSLPVSPVILPMQSGMKNVLYAYSNFCRVKAYCEENAIHVIHTHHRYPEFIAYLVSSKLNVATVTTAHSIVKGFKSLSFRSDKIVAVSNAVRDTIMRQFVTDGSKIIVLYNCVEPLRPYAEKEIVAMRRNLGIPEHHKVILYVGRFDPPKGVQYLIRAFRRISAECDKATLLLIGGTQPSFEKYDDSRIIYLPAQESAALFYQLSDLVVLPSEQDSFPYIMLEAGLAGKPFIGSRVGGIAEFIEDGHNGLLFPAKDEAALAHRILEVLNDDSMSSLLGANLRQKVASLPTCEQYCGRLDEIYRDLLFPIDPN
jgi:glycosyltransferase involved in cell wall biosynthesis